VKEEPVRERTRAQLMLALYCSDRQADALEVYRLLTRVAVGEGRTVIGFWSCKVAGAAAR
jgi:hypothetical protein